MQQLFEAVRAACSPAVWSRGVEFVRTDSVVQERADDEEIVIRVVARGGVISPQVVLYPRDREWDCDCPNRTGVCEHVAAAVIALKQAGRQEKPLPSAATSACTIGYRLSRRDGVLHFHRVVVHGEQEQALESTIASLARRVDGPPISAGQADLALELALGTVRRGPLPRQLVPKLLATLARCSDVRLDGRRIRVDGEPVLPRGQLVDHGEGFRLFVEDDSSVTEVFSNGVALCGDTLRPIGESRLSGRERHELPQGRYFGPAEVAELVTEVLPALSRRIPVEVRTDRLPRTSDLPPRILLDLQREDDTLVVLPTLVYGDPPQARIDGGRLVHLQGSVPVRDEPAERRLVRRLQRELDLAPGERARFVGERAVQLTDRLEPWNESVRGSAHEHFRRAPPLVPRVSLESGAFDVHFEAVDKDSTGRRAASADPAAVLRAWRDGQSLVPLAEGGWSPLPRDWLDRFGHRVADLLAARDAAGQLPLCVLPDLARLREELEQPGPPELDNLRVLLEDFSGIAEATLPADLQATLRPYQRRGVDWLVFLRDAGLGAMLADDMGLGKTVQALCAVRGRTLVVAPTSVLPNWAEEIRRFRPGLSYCVYHGPKRALDPGAEVTLTTYAILRLDEAELTRQSWDTVVLDEAQAIKNPDSQVARTAYRLQARFRATLTGTPVENRLDELWSQFHFVNRGLLGGRRDFEERYARPLAEGNPGVAAILRERIRPFLLRRLKREVAPELPPRTDVVLHCELAPDEREVYDTVRAATLKEVVARLEQGGGVLAALEALLRLRQAACHPGLIPGRQAEISSKVALLLESLETVVAEGHKALIFSQWTSLLDRIEPHLRSAGIEFVRLDGSTRDRAGVVRRFQDPGGPPSMLISLKAGGTGLNLTAADHVFIVDPWWNPAVEDQAADRTHRIGQDKPVLVYRLVAEETVEGRILELQQRKRAVAEAALGGADRAASLTRADLLALLD